MKNKRLAINLISSIISFIVQMGINFILTPILVDKLGNEAYGFIGLANNFVSYAMILTVALNSMASRFITVEINRKNEKKANEYYSSVFITNILLSIIVLIASSIIIFNLNQLLEIPEYLIIDVKLTFSLVFINFIITLLNTVFNVATFLKNRIDISSINQILANVIKTIVLIVLFVIFKPKIYYISIATIIYSVYIIISNIIISKRIAPELKIKYRNFNFNAVKVLILSGMWNSINSLSRVLLTRFRFINC